MNKQLYILDNEKKLIKIVNTSTDTIDIIYDDTYTSELVTGAETYTATFKVPYQDQLMLLEGNYIGFYWQGNFKLMQIKRTESVEYIDDVHITVYAEFIGIELYNSYIDNLTSDGTASKIIQDILLDTNYKLGYVSPELDSHSYRLEITEITSVYTALQTLTSTLHACEWEFTVKPINTINGEYELYVNCYANGERGMKRYTRFEADRNSYGMKREGDITNFCSGIIPVGQNGLTITDAKWEVSQGDPLDKPLGQNYLFDPEAHALLNNGGKYILMKYKSDATDIYTLMWDGYNKLQELNSTKFSYDIPVYMTDNYYETIDIGDTNYIVNKKFNPPIQLEARISKFEISFTDRSKNKITLANFKEIKSKGTGFTYEELTEHILGKFTGTLTESDIAMIRNYLEQLGLDRDTIDKLIENFRKRLPEEPPISAPEKPKDDPVNPGNPGVGDDKEDYSTIKLNSIDNGLWIGDDRIYDIIKYESAKIETSETIKNVVVTNPNKEVSSSTAAEYKEACEYYKKFWLGNLANHTQMSGIKSKSNKYKIYAAVEYWSAKFGLDPELVYAMISAESSGNPYCATSYSGGGYGLMQCEREAYFGHTTTVKFLDGSTQKFTPSYSTMKPGSCGNITLNGVSVDKAISNQVMFGCHEFRVSLRRFKWNIFASLVGYNFGLYGCDLLICRYVAMKNGLSWVNKYGYKCQSAKVQELYFKQLEDPKAPWADGRQWYKKNKKAGTPNNIELYLRWYKIRNGQLPYVLDDSGQKRGYGANFTNTPTNPTPPSTPNPPDNTTPGKPGVAEDIRKKICAKALEITELHQKYKQATYWGAYAIYDDSKRYRAKGTYNGIKNPYCYVCSSLSSCAYKYAGITSVTGWNHSNCSEGTLVKAATAKPGYLMEKLTANTIDHLLPGDLLMISNATVPSNLTISWASARGGNKRKDAGTHHVLVYMGKVDGTRMVAHASGNKSWPRAIRYEKMFDCYGSKYWYTHAFILRPWDLAKADREATPVPSQPKDPTTPPSPGDPKDPVDLQPQTEVVLKGVPGATPSDYISNGMLIQNIAINNIEDNTPFPDTVSHVFCHFGINDLSELQVNSYIELLKLLVKKYPKKPIFVAQEPYVSASYGTDYEEINEQIQVFNDELHTFCNETPYVIFISLPEGLASTSDKSYYNSSYTNNGWRFKDEKSVDKYYAEYKKKILSIATGGYNPGTEEIIDITILSAQLYRFTNRAKSVTYKLPSRVAEDYYGRLIFTTNVNSNPTKYIQPDSLYLLGDDCTNGQLIPQPDTTYSITVYYNPGSEITDKQYLGSVAAKHNGGNYTPFGKFKDQEVLIEMAQSFVDNKDKFVYDTNTPLDFSNPANHVDSWTTGDKFNIDNLTFISYVLSGWSYSGSHYNNLSKSNINKNSKYSWAIPVLRNNAEIGKYFVEKGWVIHGADLETFSNINPGDIIFMDSDDADNGKFMSINRAVIVIGRDSSGNMQAIECSNNSNVFNIRDVSSYLKSHILFIGRIRVYGDSTPKECKITTSLTNCSINNSTQSVVSGQSYSATITANTDYDIDIYNVKVTMGGVDITSLVCSQE